MRLGHRGEREVETETLGGGDLQEGSGTWRVAAREREEEEGGALGLLLFLLCLLSSPPPLFI